MPPAAKSYQVAVFVVAIFTAAGFLYESSVVSTLVRRRLNTPPDTNFSATDVDVVAAEQPKDEMVERFKKRRETLFRECRKHFGYDPEIAASRAVDGIVTNNPAFFDNTFFDDRYKILFCTIPKVASTNVKEMLLSLVDRRTVTLPGGYVGIKVVPQIHRLSDPQAVTTTRMNYTKIIVVRHPIDRLISAWRDKYSRGWPPDHPELKEIGLHMIQRYGLPFREKLAPPSLEEFFAYIHNEAGRQATLEDDVHWRTYTRQCDPCHVEYDYIVHYENLDEELGYAMKTATGLRIELPKPAKGSFAAQLPSLLTNGPAINKTRLQSLYARQLPAGLIEKVTQRYAPDFDIFGYPRTA